MKWLTKNKNRIFIFFILILFVNLNIKAETEAERRASIRYFQEHLDREEKKTQQEADRIYDEKDGPGKTNYDNKETNLVSCNNLFHHRYDIIRSI